MARKSRRNVGLIGLGIIGSRVAKALRDSSFNVYVWNRTPRALPNFLGSPAEVAEVCEIIQVFVSDAEALFAVIDAFEDKLTSRHVILCNATVGPDATIEAARSVTEKGAKFVDAPFTGSRLAAERSEMVYYLGGEDDLLDRVDPILRVSSKATVRVGHVGQAAAVKIATNMLVAATGQALAETAAVVQRAGVNPVVLEEALEHHAVHSKLIDMKLPMMLQGDYEPHFSVRNLLKDVQLALALANSREIEIPATAATARALEEGVSQGWGELDFAAVMKVYQEGDAVPPQIAAEEVPPETVVNPDPPTDAVEVPVPKSEASAEEPDSETAEAIAGQTPAAENEREGEGAPMELARAATSPDENTPENPQPSETIVDLPPQDAEVLPPSENPQTEEPVSEETTESPEAEENPSREDRVPARGLLRRLFG